MITSRRNGFFTASIILLMISLAVISGGLGLVSGRDLSHSSISGYDRMYLKGKEQLHDLETMLNADPRFPDGRSFMDYVLKYPHTGYAANGILLNYKDNITLPGGGSRHCFTMTEKVSGIPFVKPVAVLTREDGSIELKLLGILE